MPYSTYYLKDGYEASDVMKALIGDDFINDHKDDCSRYRGYINYKIKGIDLIDISSYAQYWERRGWQLSSTDLANYCLNPEAFRMFDMPERMSDYLKYPYISED